MTFLEVWIGYALIGVLIFALMFAWAVRTGQFTDMDRVRYIAIDQSEVVERPHGRLSVFDRFAGYMIGLIAVIALGYTLWIALR